MHNETQGDAADQVQAMIVRQKEEAARFAEEQQEVARVMAEQQERAA